MLLFQQLNQYFNTLYDVLLVATGEDSDELTKKWKRIKILQQYT